LFPMVWWIDACQELPWRLLYI